MMRALGLFGSSRKNRRLPFFSALGGAGVPCVESGSWRSKRMQHNMGLCCMGLWDRGRGVNSRRGGRL